jgi:hypothetical protein
MSEKVKLVCNMLLQLFAIIVFLLILFYCAEQISKALDIPLLVPILSISGITALVISMLFTIPKGRIEENG